MDARSERVAERFELPLMVAALLVIPLLIIDQADPGDAWAVVEVVLDWGTWLVFAAEVVVVLAIVPDRRRWLREHPVDWVVTIISPPLLPTSMAGVRLLRLLPVVRLLRLGPLARRVFSLDGVKYAGILAGSIAERFIAHEVDTELQVTEAELQHELREVAQRLERIELLMTRRASSALRSGAVGAPRGLRCPRAASPDLRLSL